MSTDDITAAAETDPRFPSGKWVGYFLMPHTGAARHPTELALLFTSGRMTGEGRDKVGEFAIDGRYDLKDGRCLWNKHYKGAHDVSYQGYNEGKGIWGIWMIPNPPGLPTKGGFHIWPEDHGNPDSPELSEAADPPVDIEKPDPVLIPV